MKKLIVFILLFFLFAGCGIKELFKKKKENSYSNVEQTYQITVPVVTSAATRGILVKYIKTSGIAESKKKAELTSELSGKIKRILTEDNSYHDQNEILIELEKESLLLELAKAKVDLQKAQAEYNAWKKLGNESDDFQLRLQTGLKDAELAIERINLDLEKSTIKMPFSGIVSKLEVAEGEYITAGRRMGKVYDLNQILIKADILESEISRIKTKAEVDILFQAYPNKRFNGKIISISPYIDPTARTCELYIDLENDGSIKDGMYARIKIAAETYPNKLLIYKDAILVRDGKDLVFAVDDGLAKWQYVDTGVENDYFIEITNGVSEGQQIVIEGNFSLSHDAKVEISETITFLELNRQF